ncbi:MAG: hypothetical protein EHM67_16245 [Hyphomicrobiaceae bacterium]|nr:MAG: hypothetical protein EHM67_16245 [Hyphomicrobiaceae bacterium]
MRLATTLRQALGASRRITAAGFLIGCLMCPATGLRKEQSMLDAILLALGFGFFALSVAYAYGCDRL